MDVSLGLINSLQGQVEGLEPLSEPFEQDVGPADLVLVLDLGNQARLSLEAPQLLVDVELAEVADHSLEHLGLVLLFLHVLEDSLESLSFELVKLVICLLVDDLLA